MNISWNKKTIWILVIAIIFFMGGIAFYLLSMKNHHYSMGSQHHAQHLKHHEHDEVNMPGLQGEDITDQEVNDLKQLFQKHNEIKRLVENIPMVLLRLPRAIMKNCALVLLIMSR